MDRGRGAAARGRRPGRRLQRRRRCSSRSRTRTGARRSTSSTTRWRAGPPARPGVVERLGRAGRRAATPRPPCRCTAPVLLVATPLHNDLESVEVVRHRVIVAATLATAFAIVLGYAARDALRAPDPPARGGGGADRRTGASTSRWSTRRPTSSGSSRVRSSACGCGSPRSTAPAPSSSRTPRTSCGRRSSRSPASSS